MSEEKNFVTCPCQNCNGQIEFNTSLFQAGTMTSCPHCGMETPLFIPNALKASEEIIKKDPPKTAKLVKHTTFSPSGMECTLDEVGGIFLFLGVLGGIIAIIAAIVAFNNNKTGVGVDLLCVGIVSIFVSTVNRIVFKAGAEMIRLLKKLNGLKFSGEITQPIASDNYNCSSCGRLAGLSSEQCYFCSAKFEK